MEFTIDRDLFLNSLERICTVSKSGRKDFERFDHLSIKAEAGRLLLAGANGYVHAVQEVKDEDLLSVITEGEVVVEASKMRNIVHAAEEDTRLKIKKNVGADGGGTVSRDILGQKRKLKIPFAPDVEVDFELKEVSSKSVFRIASDTFRSSAREILPYAGQEDYKGQYKFILMEFYHDETRFVATDGSTIAILTNKDDTNSQKIQAGSKCGYVIPMDQVPVLCALFDESSKITMTFEPTTYGFETDTGLKVVLNGLQREYLDYLPYTVQSERFDERLMSVEMDSNALTSLVADLQSVRDAAYEKRKNCIAVTVSAKKGEKQFGAKADFTNELECYMPIMENPKIYKEGVESISDEFPLTVFPQVLKFGSSERYEFSFLGDRDTVFCKFVDNNDIDCSRLILFGPVVETDDE